MTSEDYKTLFILNTPWMSQQQMKTFRLVKEQEYTDMEKSVSYLDHGSTEATTGPQPAANEQSSNLLIQENSPPLSPDQLQVLYTSQSD